MEAEGNEMSDLDMYDEDHMTEDEKIVHRHMMRNEICKFIKGSAIQDEYIGQFTTDESFQKLFEVRGRGALISGGKRTDELAAAMQREMLRMATDGFNRVLKEERLRYKTDFTTMVSDIDRWILNKYSHIKTVENGPTTYSREARRKRIGEHWKDDTSLPFTNVPARWTLVTHHVSTEVKVNPITHNGIPVNEPPVATDGTHIFVFLEMLYNWETKHLTYDMFPASVNALTNHVRTIYEKGFTGLDDKYRQPNLGLEYGEVLALIKRGCKIGLKGNK